MAPNARRWPTASIERPQEEFKHRIKTQSVLPSVETAAMLFWALLAAGQITMRKVDGWQKGIRSGIQASGRRAPSLSSGKVHIG